VSHAAHSHAARVLKLAGNTGERLRGRESEAKTREKGVERRETVHLDG
jgi:hypothetical protein